MAELNLRIDEKFNKTLADLVSGNDDARNKADILQRAVATYKYFRTSLPEGAKIQVVDQNGKVIQSDITVP